MRWLFWAKIFRNLIIRFVYLDMSTYLINPTDEQEKIIEAFLEALDITFVKNYSLEKLPEHVIKGIKEGIEDFEAGRYITMDEFKKTLSIFK